MSETTENKKPWYQWDSEGESLPECYDRRLMSAPILTPAELEQLHQLRTITWDGNVISKAARTSLHKKGLVVRFNGWQVVSEEGMAVLSVLGKLNDREYPVYHKRR